MAFKVNQNVWTGDIWDGWPLLGPSTIWFTFKAISKSLINKRHMSIKVNHRFCNSLLRTYVLNLFTFFICPFSWVLRVYGFQKLLTKTLYAQDHLKNHKFWCTWDGLMFALNKGFWTNYIVILTYYLKYLRLSDSIQWNFSLEPDIFGH